MKFEYNVNENIYINIYIKVLTENESMQENNFEFVENECVCITKLFTQINEYLIAYNRVHYTLYKIEFENKAINLYLVEY